MTDLVSTRATADQQGSGVEHPSESPGKPMGAVNHTKPKPPTKLPVSIERGGDLLPEIAKNVEEIKKNTSPPVARKLTSEEQNTFMGILGTAPAQSSVAMRIVGGGGDVSEFSQQVLRAFKGSPVWTMSSVNYIGNSITTIIGDEGVSTAYGYGIECSSSNPDDPAFLVVQRAFASIDYPCKVVRWLLIPRNSGAKVVVSIGPQKKQD